MDRSFPIALLLLGLVLLLAGGAWAATAGPYDLSWFTLDGGGGTSARDGYTLSGMAGQADAIVSAGNGYTLAGGFWPGGEVAPAPAQQVYLPIVQAP
jgi:hypothetical protein